MLKKFCLFNYFDGKANENIKDFVVSFDHLKKFSTLLEGKDQNNKLKESTQVKEFDITDENVD